MPFLKNDRIITLFFTGEMQFYDMQRQYEELLKQFLEDENYEDAELLRKEAISKGLKTILRLPGPDHRTS